MPLNFNPHSVNLAKDFIFLRIEVNNPARIIIRPWPTANANNINIASPIFFPMAAKAIIPAKIGVEHGVPPSAKVIPSSTGYINIELLLFCGMALIIVGSSKSNRPNNFNPIINKIEAIMRVKYPPNADAKTVPVRAQRIPIIENTIAVPRIKQQSCRKIIYGVFFEYPPTYPIISGSIAIEHGEIDASNPPTKDNASNMYQA